MMNMIKASALALSVVAFSAFAQGEAAKPAEAPKAAEAPAAKPAKKKSMKEAKKECQAENPALKGKELKECIKGKRM